MSTKKNRREFLKQSLTLGTSLSIGSLGLASCSNNRCSKSTADIGIDFSRIAYCCINCDDCPLYKATIDNDDKAKMEIAKKWGDAEKPSFKLKDYYCYGCKDKRSCSIPGNECTVRPCAVKKGFATCAQCPDFEACDKELWKKYPTMRDGVRDIKAKLGLT